jgi:hypothetical protein
MKITPLPSGTEPAEAQIQYAAYLLWVEKGRPEGCDLDTWLSAEKTIRHPQILSAKPPHRRTKTSTGRHLAGKN